MSNRKRLHAINSRVHYHHITNIPHENRHLFENVTADFETISDAVTAPAQIDRALTACVNSSMPVAIEIPQDLYYMPCVQPVGTLSAIRQATSYETMQEM